MTDGSPTSPLRILEVAALPFPSRQGTQVALDSMCRGLAERGHEIHLLAYAHGAFHVNAPYEIHRLPDSPRFRSLRSGPDWRRALLDLRLAAEVRRLAGALRPDVVHLHNVEAAAATLLLTFRPAPRCVYHAHNLMEHELPAYGTIGPRALTGRLGRFLDASLPARADLTIAISRSTRDGLVRAGADPARVRVVEPGADLEDLAGGPVPQPGAPPDTPEGFRVAYLGNLDRYQGVDRILDALALLRRRGLPAELVAISDSAPGSLSRRAGTLGLPARFVPHGTLADAISALRGCRVAALGRTVPGGFPMKLLVLLAARVPVAAVRTAVDGLDVDTAVVAARDDTPEALAEALQAAAGDAGRADRVAAGLRLARERFSRSAAAARLETVLHEARV
mgnify:CR=1 FL=1